MDVSFFIATVLLSENSKFRVTDQLHGARQVVLAKHDVRLKIVRQVVQAA